MELEASRRKSVRCCHLHTYSTKQNSKTQHSHRINMTQTNVPPAKLWNTCTIKKSLYLWHANTYNPKLPQHRALSSLKAFPCRNSHAWPYLLLAVLQHVLELGELLVLICFDTFCFVSEPTGVILLQSLNGLLLLLFKILHFLVILALLTLHGYNQQTLASAWQDDCLYFIQYYKINTDQQPEAVFLDLYCLGGRRELTVKDI